MIAALLVYIAHISTGQFDAGAIWIWSAVEDMTQRYIGF